MPRINRNLFLFRLSFAFFLGAAVAFLMHEHLVFTICIMIQGFLYLLVAFKKCHLCNRYEYRINQDFRMDYSPIHAAKRLIKLLKYGHRCEDLD